MKLKQNDFRLLLALNFKNHLFPQHLIEKSRLDTNLNRV